MTVFEDGACGEEIRFRWGHRGGAPTMGLAPLWEEEETPELSPSHRWGHSKKAAICLPARESDLTGKGPSQQHLALGSQPLEA